MKNKILLIVISLSAILFSSCKKDHGMDTTTTVTMPAPPKAYSVTENFDEGSITAYAAANVTLSTGSWNFIDALLGSLAADL